MDRRYFEAIGKYFPGITVDDICEFNAGWDYFVCAVKGKTAFRFPRREEYARQLPNEVSFLHEFAPLSPVPVPVPTLDRLPDGSPFVTYVFIPGDPFTPECATGFTAAELDGIAVQLGGFLSALHSFPVEKVTRLGFHTVDVLAAHEERGNESKELVYPLLTAAEQDWLTGRLDAYLEMITRHPPVCTPTHTDLLPEHMIIDARSHRLNGVIDYGDLEVYDPAADFTFLAHYGRRFLDTVYSNYLSPRDALFEERRLFYENYLYVLALKYSVEKGNTSRIPFYKNALCEHILVAQTRC
jgi:aminoglycoside 2''-phosphotransferase